MPEHSWKFDALGTQWEIVTVLAFTTEMRREVESLIEEFDATFSRFRKDTLVGGLRKANAQVVFPSDYTSLFELYESVGELTGWRVTPLVGGVLESAGYGPGYRLTPVENIPIVPDYTTTLRRHGSTITARASVVFDVGAAGKGFLVDIIAKRLIKAGHDAFVIDASGDIRIHGYRQTVGLENPFNLDEVVGSIEVNDMSLAASAVNRRAWNEWHHVIDPTTSRPTREVVAAWAMAKDAAVADILATALFFTSPEILKARYNYEYLRVFADGSMEYSDTFTKGVFA